MSRTRPRMPIEAALQILAQYRSDSDVVITNQGSSRLWPRLSQHAGDFNYNPSTMGGAIPLALGVALAQPERQVIVVSGDGSLLMNLGSLVTVVDSRAANLAIVLLDNGLYEVTGGQATPGAMSELDFAAIARGCGLERVAEYGDLEGWQAAAQGWLSQAGPKFAVLRVEPLQTDCLNDSAVPIAEQIQRLKRFLGS